jgi:hypothetical protein
MQGAAPETGRRLAMREAFTPSKSAGNPPARENYTQAQIEQAVEAMMMRLSAGRSFDASAARHVAQLIGPYVNDVNTGIPPGGALVGNQTFERMVLEKAPVAALASNDPNTIAAALRSAREANITSSTFAAAQGYLHAALGSAAGAARTGGGGDTGDHGNGSARSGERPSSTSYAYGHDAALSTTAASHFARELGMGPGYAGFFVGASPGMRDALRDAIKNGTAIGEDKVRNMRDVSAVVGAIRAGKLKPDDPRIPKSVQEIIKRMKENGIDPATADPKEIRKYLKDHPDELKAAKNQNKTDDKNAAAMTDEQKRQKVDVKPKTTAPSAKKPSATAAAAPSTTL